MDLSLIEQALDLGFLAVGFVRPGRPFYFDQFCSWIEGGKYGDMTWLKRHMALRRDPVRLLEGCRTIITLAYPYSSMRPCTPDGFVTARYTEPLKADYHERLRETARILAHTIVQKYPGSKTRICVDSAPILERSFAYASGIGFIGKNNMLIIPGYGSYAFLAEILTTAKISFPGNDPMENLCGSCTMCVDACPSGALEAPFSVDASKCLSYLTVEYKGQIDKSIAARANDCFFGCDVCQQVCPFNNSESSTYMALPATDEILDMGDVAFRETFGKTALARPGLGKLKENIRALKAVRG